MQRIRDSVEDIMASQSPLKDLKSIVVSVTYAVSYKREFQGATERELLQKAVTKLRGAGLNVTTEPEFIRKVNADMQAALNWNGKDPLPERKDLPMLTQEISTYKWVDNSTVVTISTRLSESGYLARAPRGKRLITSWTAPLIYTAIVENNDLHNHLASTSAEQITDFLNDWRKQQEVAYPN